MGENRFVLNTGENFGPGGTIVNQHVGLYGHRPGLADSSRRSHPGNRSEYVDVRRHAGSAQRGAHQRVTKSGTNQIHGELSEAF